MRVRTCFLLVEIFAYIHSAAPDTPRANDRSVNIALETVLEFSDKDKAGDITILDNVRNFITKVKTAIAKTNNVESDARRDITAPTVDSFTGFIQEVVKILNTYDNTKFTNFFHILDEQIWKYHYRGCKFHELTDNYELINLITVKLDSIKRTPAPVIKANINTLSKTLKNGNYDKNIKEIVHDINSLYGQDDGEKFQKVLSDLAAYGMLKSKKSDTNLSKIIRNGVRSIMFDHYTNLNTKVRRKFKRKIETFLKQLNENHQSKDNKRNTKISDNIVNEVTKPKAVVTKYTASKKANAKIVTNQENNQERAKVKQFDYKNGSMKRDDVKYGKERYINNKINTIDRPLEVQEFEKILSPQDTGPTVPQRVKTKSQEQSSYIDASSLEFYQEPKDNTQHNKAMNSDKILQKTNSRKKNEKIKVVNLTTRSPAKNTYQNIWIEESTGRLPQAVLDKLAVKARRRESDYYNATEAVNKRGTKHNKKYDKKRKIWHGKIYVPKLGNGYNKKHETKRMTKHRSKYDSLYEPGPPGPIPRQKTKKNKKLKSDQNTQLSEPSMLIHNKDLFKKNDDSTINSVFNMKRHQYNKNMTPMSNELNSRQAGARGAATQAKKFLEVLDVQMTPGKFSVPARYGTQQTEAEFASHKEHSNRNKMLSRKHSAKRFEIKHGKRSEAYLKETQEAQTLTSLEKNLQVIRKIKNLEKEIQEVKSKMNDPKVNKDNRKQYETRSGLDAQNFINNSKRKQDKVEMAGTVDNKTKLIIKNENVQETASKNNKKKDNIEKAESQINVNADAAFMKAREYTDASQMTQDTLLKTTQTAYKKKELLIKPVKGKDFKSTDIDKKSETKFRSNDIRDRTEETNVTRTSDNKTDIIEAVVDFSDKDLKNNEIKDNTKEVQSKNNVSADIVKMKENSKGFEMMLDKLLTKTETTNNNKELSIKQFKDDDLKKKNVNGKTFETSFRSNVNIIPNDFKDKADNAKLTRIVDKKTVMIDKYSKNKEIKESIKETKSRVNGHADFVEVRKIQQSNETNKIKSTVSETESTPDHTRIIKDSIMARTAGNKTEPIQALNYNKLKDSLEKTKDRMNINVDDMKTRQFYLKDPPKEIIGKPKQSGSLSGLEGNKNTNELDDNQDRLMEVAKNMLIRPLVGKHSKTNLSTINKSIEPEASFRSNGNKILNDVQNTTGIRNTTGTDKQTNINELNKSSKINYYQTITSTKQPKIMKEDKKTETTVNTEDGKKMMRVRADDKATTGTKTGEKRLESTTSIAPTPMKSTAATTEGSTTTVVPTTPNTLKSSSTVYTSSKLPPLPVVWTTDKPLSMSSRRYFIK